MLPQRAGDEPARAAMPSAPRAPDARTADSSQPKAIRPSRPKLEPDVQHPVVRMREIRLGRGAFAQIHLLVEIGEVVQADAQPADGRAPSPATTARGPVGSRRFGVAGSGVRAGCPAMASALTSTSARRRDATEPQRQPPRPQRQQATTSATGQGAQPTARRKRQDQRQADQRRPAATASASRPARRRAGTARRVRASAPGDWPTGTRPGRAARLRPACRRCPAGPARWRPRR